MGIIPKWMTFGGGGYDSITSAYVNGMATKPATDFIKIIDELVRDKETVNGVSITMKQIIALADVIYLVNKHDSNDSFRNLVKNAHHGTKQGSGLVWDSYWGYSNPAGTGYVDTDYNPSTQGQNLTLNNVGVGVSLYDIKTPASASYPIYCYDGNRIGIDIYNALTSINFVLNAATTINSTTPFKSGLHFIRRTASNVIAHINQNIANTAGTTASIAIPNQKFFLFRRTSTGVGIYYDTLNFTYIGASLTDDQFTALNIMVNRYLKKCLYLKYGASNWGVQMAKSYFDTLHNFEPYEAWEIYEFIKRHQSDYVDSGATGYLYNTFQPTKTVADYIMLFKAGGNLASNAWTKTGATLRWNQDGSITSSNTMPAYTRGTNLGIVTVTSTDGWNGVVWFNIAQTNASVNSFYGNLPKLHLLKTGGNKLTLTTIENRTKEYYVGLNCKDLIRGIYISYRKTNTGGIKINISDLVGIVCDSNFSVFGDLATTWSKVQGDVTLLTNEFTNDTVFNLGYDKSIYGSLGNLTFGTNPATLSIFFTSIVSGTSVWSVNLGTFDVRENSFTTQAILDQLTVIKNQLTITPPIKNLTCNFSGATMGIVAANHQLILDIAAQHVAQGKTFTCTTRTS
jgi:hypothetical protein